MPDLENLKKQAKRLVRWHRDGNRSVAPILREALPRFAGMSDPDILAQPFALSEAQNVIARTEGYPDWAALKAGAETMTETNSTPSGPAPSLTAAYPQLFVADIEKSCAYFERVMGFRTLFKHGTPPFYAAIMRDGARLHLRCVDAPLMDRKLAEAETYLAAYLVVENVKALFVAFKAAGADFQQTLKREPWEVDDFVVRDPDGNLILFANAPQI